MLSAVISGVGGYVPPRVVTNDDLAERMDTSDEWIRTRSGIEQRHFADEGVSCSDLAAEASRRALADAGIAAEDLDLIILATITPDHFFPGTACYLQTKLGLHSTGCLDIRNQCTGFIYALSTADAFIRTGLYRHILVVGSEVHSSGLNFSDEGRDVAVLFGDGAGAVIVSANDDPHRGIVYSELHADGRFAKALHMNLWDISRKPYISQDNLCNPDMWPQMDGRTVFKFAVTHLCEVIQNTLEKTGTNPDEIKYVMPHQANIRINQMVAQKLAWPPEKFLHNIQHYGNTTAASIPLLLDETYRTGSLQQGDLLLLAAFGSGFTWGSVLLRW